MAREHMTNLLIKDHLETISCDTMKYFMAFHGNTWYSISYFACLQFPGSELGAPCSKHGAPWYSMLFHETKHGKTWTECPQNQPWSSMVLHVYSMFYMENMELHVCKLKSILKTWSSMASMFFHGLFYGKAWSKKWSGHYSMFHQMAICFVL